MEKENNMDKNFKKCCKCCGTELDNPKYDYCEYCGTNYPNYLKDGKMLSMKEKAIKKIDEIPCFGVGGIIMKYVNKKLIDFKYRLK